MSDLAPARSAEAKLSRALSSASSPAHLSKVITEASAAGVKVADAKRVLKLLQGLEAALTATATSRSTAAQASSLRLLHISDATTSSNVFCRGSCTIRFAVHTSGLSA